MLRNFRPGEAESAAKDAATLQDPEEAKLNVQSAAAFLERIQEDLPEAIRKLEEAEELARVEHEQLVDAQAKCAAVAESVVQAQAEIATLNEQGAAIQAEWGIR